MRQAEDLARENQALRVRLSQLAQASLRINESLDFDTVLQGVLDSACSLTGARYGVLTLMDDSKQIQNSLVFGLTPEETQELWDVLGGTAFCEYLTQMPGPLRLRDLQQHLGSLGLPEFRPPMATSPEMSFMAAPTRDLGETVGVIYVSEKEPEFTSEDEETLFMFASQAALVIANARRYRDEQRARVDLETLINTSPVGVVVFDAGTARMVSINREARRITGHLKTPDRNLEELLEVLTFRRADGREISQDEFPLARALRAGETVRAEEIVIQVPDGRSITTLVNATPIHAADGDVESVLVTLQDLAPLEELKRLRAEFLGMVSHELRAPLTSIKGSAATLLESLSSLDPAEMVQFIRIIEAQADHMRDLISDLLDVTRIETGTLSVTPEPAEVLSLVDQARNAFVRSGGRDTIEIDLAPELPRVMADPRRIVEVLNNLLTNAAKYSQATSPIRVTAVPDNVHVAIAVADEGRGVPAEQLPYLFEKFSRINDVGGEREIGGAGLGLAICKGIVEAHGGRIWAESDGPGRGTTLTFTLPMVDESVRASAQRSPLAAPARQAANARTRVLAVDDDPQTLRYVRDALTKGGYTTIVTADPAEVLSVIREERPDLVLLDLVLPGTDGINLMQEILSVSNLPVIFLSAYGRDQIIAKAFELGAADYMVKPFSPTELVARVQAALRKWATPQQTELSEPFQLGDLTMSHANRQVTVAGREVQLTATEYKLLAELAVNAGRVVTHQHLLYRVWGAAYPGGPATVRTIVQRLRRKLGDDAMAPSYIFTEPRVGYRLAKAGS